MTNISKEQSKKIKDLVRKTCCNYVKDNCLLLDDGDSHKCVQIIAESSVMCKYFEKVVLPTDKKLYDDIYSKTNGGNKK